MKYSRTLDKILAAISFQVAGNHEQAARFFGSAAKAEDITQVMSALEKATKKAFDGAQVASKKPESLAKLLEQAGKKKEVKVVAKQEEKKLVKASEDDMTSDDDMDGLLDDMTASDEDISLEDLDDATDDTVEELPEASVEEDDQEEDDEAEVSVTKVTANLAALDRLKASVKAK